MFVFGLIYSPRHVYKMYLNDTDISLPVAIGTWAIAIIIFVHACIDIHRAKRDRVSSRAAVVGACVLFTLRYFLHNDNPATWLITLAIVTVIAILAGSNKAFVASAVTISVETFAFADGGVMALGCNVINFAAIPAMASISLTRRLPFGTVGSAIVAWGVSCGLYKGLWWLERWISESVAVSSGHVTTFAESLQATTALYPAYSSLIGLFVGLCVIYALLRCFTVIFSPAQ